MFLMSYWALGNPQIFFNTPNRVELHGKDVDDTQHHPFME